MGQIGARCGFLPCLFYSSPLPLFPPPPSPPLRLPSSKLRKVFTFLKTIKKKKNSISNTTNKAPKTKEECVIDSVSCKPEIFDLWIFIEQSFMTPAPATSLPFCLYNVTFFNIKLNQYKK